MDLYQCSTVHSLYLRLGSTPWITMPSRSASRPAPDHRSGARWWAALTCSFTLSAQAHHGSAFGRTPSTASSLPRKYENFPVKAAHSVAQAAAITHSPAHRDSGLRYERQAASHASDSLRVLRAPKTRNRGSHAFPIPAPSALSSRGAPQ